MNAKRTGSPGPDRGEAARPHNATEQPHRLPSCFRHRSHRGPGPMKTRSESPTPIPQPVYFTLRNMFKARSDLPHVTGVEASGRIAARSIKNCMFRGVAICLPARTGRGPVLAQRWHAQVEVSRLKVGSDEADVMLGNDASPDDPGRSPPFNKVSRRSRMRPGQAVPPVRRCLPASLRQCEPDVSGIGCHINFFSTRRPHASMGNKRWTENPFE